MSDANIETVRAAFDGMARGDAGPFTQMLSQDLVYTVLGSTKLSGTFCGAAEVFTNLMMPLTQYLATPIRLEAQRIFGSGDLVTVQARGQAALKSGAPYNNTYCFVLRFAGGQVVEISEYLDTQLVARAFEVPEDRDELLRAMDYNMWDLFREDVRLARGGEMLETPLYWMGYNPRGIAFHNMVMVKSAIAAEALVEAAQAFYRPRGKQQYSVCLRLHADAELETALLGRGFAPLTAMPGMVLLGDPVPKPIPAGLEIRAAIDDQGRRDFIAITADAYSVYGSPREYADDAFYRLESVSAPHLQAYVGYAGGEAVSAAAVYVTHGAGGIGWVGTVAAHRGRGYAEAVTAAAVREGFRRGARFANLQASPMGRPIYERMGFVTQTEYRVLQSPS